MELVLKSLFSSPTKKKPLRKKFPHVTMDRENVLEKINKSKKQTIRFNQHEFQSRLRQINKNQKKLVKDVDAKCKSFCKKEFLPVFKSVDMEANKQLKKLKTTGKQLKTINKKAHKERISNCIMSHCNPSCEKDVYFIPPKNMKGWTKQFSNLQKQKLVKKGAISGCSKDQFFMKKIK